MLAIREILHTTSAIGNACPGLQGANGVTRNRIG